MSDDVLNLVKQLTEVLDAHQKLLDYLPHIQETIKSLETEVEVLQKQVASLQRINQQTQTRLVAMERSQQHLHQSMY